MKLTIDTGTVVCSLENKNDNFLSACAGAFDGYQGGKLKMLYDDPEKAYRSSSAAQWNVWRLKDIIRYAKRYGVEVDEAVIDYCAELERLHAFYVVQERKAREEKEQQEHWQRLCAGGCGNCCNLAYDVDVPVCNKTGEILKERNAPKDMGGVLHLFNWVAFPSEDCPFNINKIKEHKDEHLREYCGNPS